MPTLNYDNESNFAVSAIYSNRYKEANFSRKNKIWKIIVRSQYQKEVKPTDVVIDIACGHGEFINNINSGTKIAIDLNPDAASFLDSDVIFLNEDIFDGLKRYKNKIDVIFISNFLEHIETKKQLLALLIECFCSLKNGGKIVVVGPNIKYLSDVYWDFLDHYIPLSHHSAAEALELSGFKIVKMVSKFLPHSERGKALPHPILPWIYLKFPFIWKLLGKQFFIVAIKP